MSITEWLSYIDFCIQLYVKWQIRTAMFLGAGIFLGRAYIADAKYERAASMVNSKGASPGDCASIYGNMILLTTMSNPSLLYPKRLPIRAHSLVSGFSAISLPAFFFHQYNH